MRETNHTEAGFTVEQPVERAILVGVHLPLSLRDGIGGEADIAELGRLVDTAGAEVVGRIEQRLPRPVTKTFIGSGKLEQLQELVDRHDANLVVFDNELTPAQGRNLERSLEVGIIDRTELILDIFARHAKTRQARLQVEMAQLQYLLPRLTRLWSHLERQAGGIGTRGPGETQLETDRRLITRRISRLKKALAEIDVQRRVQVRKRQDLYRATLVGYTNAGKSTLMNALTGSRIYVEDQLFATLDATTRRVDADERRKYLLTDTVGFIRRLPHHLVESFKATLQEVSDADLLVHVVDASSEDPDLQIASVNTVLADLASVDKPLLLVFNKMDRVDPELINNRFGRTYPDALFISARNEADTARLAATILDTMQRDEHIFTLHVPLDRLGCLGPFHRTGSILDQDFGDGYCRSVVRMRETEIRRLLAAEPSIALVEDS